MTHHKSPDFWLALVAAVFFLLSVVPAGAGSVASLITFTAGTPAKASEVNGNFAAVKTAVDDNDARINALLARVDALESKLASVSTETVNGHPTVRFSGVNVQVVNGLGTTDTANGTGNLFVGYNEAVLGGTTKCSIGTNPIDNTTPITTEPDCTAAGGVWALQHKSGSHYLVLGPHHSYSRWGGIVAGYSSSATYDYASVTGGTNGTATGYAATISGGFANLAQGNAATVSGGRTNIAIGPSSTIIGGENNMTHDTATAGSISGGRQNHVTGTYASVSGGQNNVASGLYSSVSGGGTNTASGTVSSVSGGGSNEASGLAASISGGSSNDATGQSSSVSGGSTNTAGHLQSSILGGSGQNTSADLQTIPALP